MSTAEPIAPIAPPAPQRRLSSTTARQTPAHHQSQAELAMLAAIRAGGSASCGNATAAGPAVPGTAKRSKMLVTAASKMTSPKKVGKQGKAAKKERIARPMNSFMVFAQETRKMLRETYPDTDNKEISRMLGQKWKKLTEDEKAVYAEQAKQIAEQHKIDHPEWKFVRAPPRKGRGKVAKAAAAAAAVAYAETVTPGRTKESATHSISNSKQGTTSTSNSESRMLGGATRTGNSGKTATLLKRKVPPIVPGIELQSGVTPISPTMLSPGISTTSPMAIEQLFRLQTMQKQLLLQQQHIRSAAADTKPLPLPLPLPPPSYVAPPSIGSPNDTQPSPGVFQRIVGLGTSQLPSYFDAMEAAGGSSASSHIS